MDYLILSYPAALLLSAKPYEPLSIIVPRGRSPGPIFPSSCLPRAGLFIQTPAHACRFFGIAVVAFAV
jgi:hypothetical protein